jgi:hypothetical protein
MSQTEAPVLTKAAAPGQYLGYSLQQLRLCHHLLRTKGDYQVSFEFLDDVAVHMPGGRVLLEQCKSVTSGNPVADRAVDLWKTFANWADLAKAKKIDAATSEFRLYVAPKGNASFALELSGAHTIDAVAVALSKIKKLQKIGTQAAAVDAHIERFLAAGVEINSLVIRNFELVIDVDPDESVKGLLRLFLSGQTLDEFSVAAIGMARDRIDNLIRRNEPPIVSAPEFQASVRAFIRKNNLANLLISSTPAPSKEKISSYLNAAPVFVRQLQSVDASQPMLTTAISDWLKATADKINWANEGMVFKDSFAEFDDALIRRHILVRDEVEDTFSSKTPQRRGREVYRRCSETEMPLEGSIVPNHFVAGSYNCLADMSKLGWHPDYATLFPPGDET